MNMYVAAYVVVWTAVALYVLWMGARQRRLGRAIDALELHFQQSEILEDPTSTAA